MRLKNYLAASMTEAMNQVKEELGPDAIIISAETVDGQFKVVAALEEREDIDFNAADELKITPSRFRFDDSHLRDCLDYHGVIDTVAERILAYCRNLSLERGISDEHRLLSACFAEMFAFGSLLDLNCPVKCLWAFPVLANRPSSPKWPLRRVLIKSAAALSARIMFAPAPTTSLKPLPKFLKPTFSFAKAAAAFLTQCVPPAKIINWS